ncbi:RING-H2 finger protein ATL33 [Eucalyptus grandis]|nr:RING-H2 finger protein ATL33 [Eucalyptus grandis]
MANPAFSFNAGAFFSALSDLASSIDSPPIKSILEGLLYYVIPVVFFVLFVYVLCYVCVDDFGPPFDDLEAGTLPLLGRPCGDPPSRREALMRIDVYRSDGGEAERAECVVCLEEFEDGEACLRLTCCEQAYHRACVNRWLLDHRRCPICRATVRITPTI